jgi:preprotein translocase subunit SecG
MAEVLEQDTPVVEEYAPSSDDAPELNASAESDEPVIEALEETSEEPTK